MKCTVRAKCLFHYSIRLGIKLFTSSRRRTTTEDITSIDSIRHRLIDQHIMAYLSYLVFYETFDLGGSPFQLLGLESHPVLYINRKWHVRKLMMLLHQLKWGRTFTIRCLKHFGKYCQWWSKLISIVDCDNLKFDAMRELLENIFF